LKVKARRANPASRPCLRSYPIVVRRQTRNFRKLVSRLNGKGRFQPNLSTRPITAHEPVSWCWLGTTVRILWSVVLMPRASPAKLTCEWIGNVTLDAGIGLHRMKSRRGQWIKWLASHLQCCAALSVSISRNRQTRRCAGHIRPTRCARSAPGSRSGSWRFPAACLPQTVPESSRCDRCTARAETQGH